MGMSAVHAVDAVTVADPIEVLWDEVLVCGRDVDGGSAADQRLEILLLVLFHMWFLSGQWPVVVCCRFAGYSLMVTLLNRASQSAECIEFNRVSCAELTLLNSSCL